MIVSKETPLFFVALADAGQVFWADETDVSTPACKSTVFSHMAIISFERALLLKLMSCLVFWPVSFFVTAKYSIMDV